MSYLKRISKLWLLALFEGLGMGLFSFTITYIVTAGGAPPIYPALALTLCIALLAPLTGGHVNPAVTVTLLLAGLVGKYRVKTGGERVILITQSLLYILFQFLGAYLGSLFARWFNGSWYEGETFAGLVEMLGNYKGGNFWKFFLSEFFGTLLLTFSVTCLVYRGSFGDVGPLLVGLTVFVLGTTMGAYSGGMYNPGISFGLLLSGLSAMTKEQADVQVFSGNLYKLGGSALGFALLAEFAGAIAAWALNMLAQLAKSRGDEVGSEQMNLEGGNFQKSSSDEVPEFRDDAIRTHSTDSV